MWISYWSSKISNKDRIAVAGKIIPRYIVGVSKLILFPSLYNHIEFISLHLMHFTTYNINFFEQNLTSKKFHICFDISRNLCAGHTWGAIYLQCRFCTNLFLPGGRIHSWDGFPDNKWSSKQANKKTWQADYKSYEKKNSFMEK